MSIFNGKWKRTSSTNTDAVVKALSADSPDMAAKLGVYFKGDAEVIEEFHLEGDNAQRKTHIGGKMIHDVTCKLGEVTESKLAYGDFKYTCNKLTDNVMEAIDHSKGREGARSVMTVEGNKLNLDYTVNDVSCHIVFEKI